MRFIHIGDAHIREQTWANIPEVRGDAFAACTKVRDFALSEKIDVLILSGDVFHSSKPTSRDLEIFNHLIEPFSNVLFIEGNHETAKPMWLESLNNDKLHHMTPYCPNSVGDACFYGIDYARSRNDLLSALDKVSVLDPDGVSNFLVMHCGFRHMINFEGASQLDASDVSGFPGTILVSHVHKRHTYKNIHSPGPMFPQSWEEVVPCYVDVIDTYTPTIGSLDVTVRNYHTLKLSELNGFKDTPRELPTLIRVLTDDPKDIIPEVPGCIVIPMITGKSTDDSSHEISLDVMSIDDAIMAEYDDPEDGRLMIDLFHSESPDKHIEDFLKSNNIDRRSL